MDEYSVSRTTKWAEAPSLGKEFKDGLSPRWKSGARVRAITDRDLVSREDAEVHRMLVVNLRHLRQHAAMIERLMRHGVH